ncbi:MAG: FtsX-like permease family protein [Syntrophobacteraceae bacterium]|nr:FtsX-like permease family protein [Desulfobacteraceae bacterium]
MSAPIAALLFLMFLLVPIGEASAQYYPEDEAFLGGIGDRSAGMPGSDLAADYILKVFADAGLQKVGAQEFLTPVTQLVSASLEVAGKTFSVYPWGPNLVYLPVTPGEGVGGTLIYVGSGDFSSMDGHPIRDSIVLMDMNSGEKWLNAAMLGARAIVFLDSGKSVSGDFGIKKTNTPIAVPRFWVGQETGAELRRLALDSREYRATVKSAAVWKNKMVRNCYGLLPGSNPDLKTELIVLDAFYDSSSPVLGTAPGADEASSILILLSLVRQLAEAPPERPVLFLATVNNGQSIAGTRQFIWSVTARSNHLQREAKQLRKQKRAADRLLAMAQKEDPFSVESGEEREFLARLVEDRAKDRSDDLAREIQYRNAMGQMGMPPSLDPKPYRNLSAIGSLAQLGPIQLQLARQLVRDALPDLQAGLHEIKRRERAIESSVRLRELMDEFKPVLFLNLHLSSHSRSIGLAEMGDTYPVRESVRRIVRSTRLLNFLNQSGAEVSETTGLPNLVRTRVRGSSADTDASRFSGTMRACCDVGILAGLPAVSLVSLDDDRSFWNTPHDTGDRTDRANLLALSRFLPPLLTRLFSHPSLRLASESGIPGLASLEGRAMIVRQGELFPDRPAPGTIVSVIQGSSVFRAMVHRDGSFFIPGLANRRVSLEKLIVEPYGLDPASGRIAWATDKVKTGKVNYRLAVKRDTASTSLVMFPCTQTDVIQAFNPQTLGYLTKADIIDSVTGAPPLRHWFSRVDGRDTTAISILLEKGTRFKLVMSDSLLRKELLLLNSTSENPEGRGFLAGDPAILPVVPLQVAQDMYHLLRERIERLTRHGIVNRHLETLFQDASGTLKQSSEDIGSYRYEDFWTHVVSSWARLNLVYNEVESTQRDVLGGVMFFIALFVPFAYCVERFLFAFRNIYQQLSAFFLILVATILAIKSLNPAFQLTYSPMVVIIAFFIVGLSLLVSWILFMRFEREMSELRRHASQVKTPQDGKWQAFGAGFSIGVSNLNRRKLRTGLSCLTLVILTFTVMSFTNVKSLHSTARTRIADDASYNGVLLHHQYRLSLGPLTFESVRTLFADGGERVWPRGWIEPPNASERTVGRAFRGERHASLESILGMGEAAPQCVQSAIVRGRWFEPGEEDAVLLPVFIARRLGLDPAGDSDVSISIDGYPFKVIGYFDAAVLDSLKDLDQNSFLPSFLEIKQGEEASEAEIEAMQSGEEVLPQSERFRYASADRTVIVPFKTCIRHGGALKVISVLPRNGDSPFKAADRLSSWLAYPLFVGENGTWYHSAVSTLRYQGAANLLVPILIVIFITLNTMIGHVHERQREIATYTSVGLAPTHVAFLFIVEALSMAVISTVVGYILAQLSAKYLGHTALFSQLTFNYSSLASVACMFLVFSVVFLASLYPARVAATIAMPDVNHSWNLPEPEGDAIVMNLPFLLKGEEENGVMGFLHAYYASHKDTVNEAFITDEIAMSLDVPRGGSAAPPPPACLLLRTTVWLAPFDFGIKQILQLHCCPSMDNVGYLEIAIRMVRISGERSAWVRANRNFVKQLRKQMLLWRLLDDQGKASFEDTATDRMLPGGSIAAAESALRGDD